MRVFDELSIFSEICIPLVQVLRLMVADGSNDDGDFQFPALNGQPKPNVYKVRASVCREKGVREEECLGDQQWCNFKIIQAFELCASCRP